MGWLFESTTDRQAKEAAQREIVRRKKKAILAKQSDRDARKAAVSRAGWGLWRSD